MAVWLGPVQLAVRALLRFGGGRRAVMRWQQPATLGLQAGILAASALAGQAFGGQAAVTAAVLGLAFFLLTQDLAWRWLPLEWSAPFLALGLFAGFLGENAADTLAGAALGGGLLWGLQVVFRYLRGVEGLGTGDIWLAAGIGAFVGLDTIAWVLALAALSGLAVNALQNRVKKSPARNRWGVAYGAHLVAAFVIVSAF